jgi:hypothetical protein
VILIITQSQDLTADFVIRHLTAGHHRYLRLDTDRLGTPECNFGFVDGPLLHLAGETVSPAAIGAVWYRRFATPSLLDRTAQQHRDFVRRELASVMDAFLESIPNDRAINAAEADRLSGNRLLQAGRARAVGLAVPATLVTQQVEAARAFVAQHDEAVTKAISYGRTSSPENDPGLFAHTSPVSSGTDLSGVAACPALLQEKVPKRWEWRVTSVGREVFAARIDALGHAALDWRERPDVLSAFERADLPDPVRGQLMALADLSGIVYGAHDLIETPDGRFVFLETNPAGQWGWLEVTLGLPVGRAIADELIERAGRIS